MAEARVKPTQLLGNDASENVTRLLEVLKHSPYGIYWHQGQLHSLRRNRAGQLDLIPLTRESLTYFVEAAVLIERKDGRGKSVRGLSAELALLTLRAPEEAMEAAKIPLLEQVIEGVTVDRYGVTTVLPGYHPATATYIDLPESLQVPEHPSSRDIDQARDLIMRAFDSFPFSSAVDLLNIVSLPVTLILRPYIDGPTPLYAINAQHEGAGKSALAMRACSLARGGIDVKTPLDDDAEIRKNITSALAAQEPVYCIDNVQSESQMLDSATLQAYLTATWWGDRRLGTNSLAKYRATMVVIATGINLSMGAETGRRSLPVMLTQRPDSVDTAEEIFSPMPTTTEYVAYQQAWGTIMRAWEHRGRPRGGARLPSYDAWASIVSGILNVMGLPGDTLGSNQHVFRAKRDTDRHELQEFVSAWWATFGDVEVTTAQLHDHLLQHSELLATLLRRASRSPSHHALTISLGLILRRREGTQLGPYQWQACGMNYERKVRLFKLIHSGGQRPPGKRQQQTEDVEASEEERPF